MVRISVTLLALAATALTASVDARSAGDLSAPIHHFHSRSLSSIYLERRQAPPAPTESDKKFEEFQGTLNDDQKAKGKLADEKATEAEKSLTDDQRKQLDEVDKLESQGKSTDADKKYQEFEKTLSDDQKKKGKDAEDAANAAEASLTEDQKKALDEVDRLDAQAAKGGR